jgi:2-polyprenyl-3-methyl-5-hydroxy-6-metoxy-1,4-benzoquinol methylase
MSIEPEIIASETYRKAVREKIIADVIGAERYRQSPEVFESALADHMDRRYNSFKASVLPWLRRHIGLAGQSIVEIGSGTGASTLAVLPDVEHVACFDIDKPAVGVAELRLRLAGYANYALHSTAFTADTAKGLGRVDGVFLAAVLEHTTFGECLDILRDTWNVIRPGGWLCVVDTPNRFAAFDHHTALLPFFSMLPPEVRMAYALHSPRREFAEAFPAADTQPMEVRLEKLARWGAGISYHEFEIALGADIHHHIIADGYEPEIVSAIGVLPEDSLCQLQFSLFAPHVHRAFSRRAFHMIIRKPS